ncbi:hypothetical protein BGW36DRAFT_400889 [Talaromyces proteolyticus]|uniref:Clr5 domain-containing protein n=1 Tax=Talaromyces proteolyticus TaxID=1131652 RepID=A0AAD4KN02_9EURO|nr:uncharacterized protein BGW36DRAFT_400889 [Talaromyces proteolyticus]KAH8691665.1 hypothetical protein BGW36DRAFT_400889 [Talaromyces proteolyticus]
MYPHIRRLYVYERRTLRYVIAHIREKYNFQATPQMYKKRFTKWGFYKNTRRARVNSTSPRSTEPSDVIWQPQLTLMPTLNRTDMSILIFLTNIRTWCSAFFETARESHLDFLEGTSRLSLLLPYKQTVSYDQEQISASFRLVADLLVRGQGHLAGRLARKAFLQIEHMLQLEGPPFIWNLLEILHNIMYLKQGRLFSMLIIHLMSLAQCHYPENHSIVQLLQSLWHISKSSENDFIQLLPAILERGWLLNADILFSNFNERFLLLYYRLMWNSGLLRLTEDKLREADTWFSLLSLRVPIEAIMEGTARLHPAVDFAPADASNLPPANYEDLKRKAIADLHERAELESPEPTTRFRLLSGLLKSRILDENVKFPDEGGKEGSNLIMDDNATVETRGRATRLHARILAYILDLFTYIDMEKGGSENIIIERLNNTIALRDYGEGVTAPQVIVEIWRLRDMLLQKGKLLEAAEMGKTAQKRLEQYLEDMPCLHI